MKRHLTRTKSKFYTGEKDEYDYCLLYCLLSILLEVKSTRLHSSMLVRCMVILCSCSACYRFTQKDQDAKDKAKAAAESAAANKAAQKVSTGTELDVCDPHRSYLHLRYLRFVGFWKPGGTFGVRYDMTTQFSGMTTLSEVALGGKDSLVMCVPLRMSFCLRKLLLDERRSWTFRRWSIGSLQLRLASYWFAAFVV